MCGIGILVSTGDLAFQKLRVEDMMAAVSHRGPDAEGVFAEGQVQLGHRRLSIVDLSPGANQPFHRGGLSIVFNGEIYNYVEIRTELAGLGRHFKTKSDTEVILAAYEHWGEDCVRRFDGMWAFAILDSSRRRVILSRDRFGEKPLFYMRTPGGLAAASEIMQFACLGLSLRARPDAVGRFLIFGEEDFGEETFIEGVRKLPPAHNLILDLESGESTLTRYYTPGSSREFLGVGVTEFQNVLELELRASVMRRLRSDVDVGSCLSGGIDSSLIVALAAEIRRGEGLSPPVSFTAVSGDRNNDEWEYASAVARAVGAVSVPVEANGDVMARHLKAALAAQDEPSGGPSIVMQYLVMKSASEAGCKVLLDGQGADEVWLGYRRYGAQAARTLPVGQRVAFLRKWARNSDMSQIDLAVNYGFFGYPMTQSAIRTLRGRRTGKLLGIGSAHSKQGNVGNSRHSTLSHQERVRQITQHLPHLLRYEDMNSMHFSVETRLPYLDWRVVELGLAAPVGVLLADGWSKTPLRTLLEKLLPDTVAWRKRKIGFEVPSDVWVTVYRLLQEANESSTGLRAFAFDGKGVMGISRPVAWRLLALADWERKMGVDLGAATSVLTN